MTFRSPKTRAMGVVLLAGFAVAFAGFLTGAVGFGLSLALCFLIWIGGAFRVNRKARPHLPVRGSGTELPAPVRYGERRGHHLHRAKQGRPARPRPWRASDPR